MNERFEELKKQAMIRVNTPTVNSDGKVICDNWEEGISLSKFAELIVRECARVCAKIELDEELSAEADIWDGAMMCRVEIMEHFGVEE